MKYRGRVFVFLQEIHGAFEKFGEWSQILEPHWFGYQMNASNKENQRRKLMKC